LKKVYRIRNAKDLSRVEISTERSQLIDFVIEGSNHLDLLYGQGAEKLIQPLVIRAVRQAWAGWTYPEQQQEQQEKRGAKQEAA
jgi:hypothetical protein